MLCGYMLHKSLMTSLAQLKYLVWILHKEATCPENRNIKYKGFLLYQIVYFQLISLHLGLNNHYVTYIMPS